MQWEPVHVAPRQFIEDERPGGIRVQYGAGVVQVLKQPRIRNDSIVEEGLRCSNGRCEAANTVVPLVSVTRLEVRTTDVGKTIIAIVGTSALIVGAIAIKKAFDCWGLLAPTC